MPRVSSRIRWDQSDGKYRVAVFARADHASFRVESGFRGYRPLSQTAHIESEAIDLAKGIWLAYQRGEIEAQEVAPETLDEFLTLLCERPEHTTKTRRSYRAVWDLLVAQLGDGRHPTRIYPLDVRTFLARVSGATRDTYLRTLRAGFRHAIAEGWIKEDPTAGLKAEHKHVMGPWLPSEEWPAFLAACTAAHRIRAAFVLETGLRAGELAAARWDWLHGQVGMRAIRIAEDSRSSFVPKWGVARAVPLSHSALATLELAEARWGGTGYIFSKDGLSSLTNFAAETREAVARANCTPTDFHGLRRSAGAMWLENGASLYEVSRLLGHQDPKITAKWYAGMSDRHLAETIGRVDDARAARAGVTPIRSAKRSAKDRAQGSGR